MLVEEMSRSLLSQYQAELYSFNNNFGVFCLSEIRDCVLMWAHYADCHRGLAVGFDSEHPFFSTKRRPDDEFGFLRRVHYQVNRPHVMMSATSSIEWFQTKADVWSYEKEWRLVRVASHANKTVQGKGPFPICLFEFPSEAVVEIVVGMRANDALRSEVRSLAAQFPRAKLLAVAANPTKFALKIGDLT